MFSNRFSILVIPILINLHLPLIYHHWLWLWFFHSTRNFPSIVNCYVKYIHSLLWNKWLFYFCFVMECQMIEIVCLYVRDWKDTGFLFDLRMNEGTNWNIKMSINYTFFHMDFTKIFSCFILNVMNWDWIGNRVTCDGHGGDGGCDGDDDATMIVMIARVTAMIAEGEQNQNKIVNRNIHLQSIILTLIWTYEYECVCLIIIFISIKHHIFVYIISFRHECKRKLYWQWINIWSKLYTSQTTYYKVT